MGGGAQSIRGGGGWGGNQAWEWYQGSDEITWPPLCQPESFSTYFRAILQILHHEQKAKDLWFMSSLKITWRELRKWHGEWRTCPAQEGWPLFASGIWAISRTADQGTGVEHLVHAPLMLLAHRKKEYGTFESFTLIAWVLGEYLLKHENILERTRFGGHYTPTNNRTSRSSTGPSFWV